MKLATASISISALMCLAGVVHAAVVLDSSVNFATNAGDPSAIVRQNTYTFDNAIDLGGFDPTGSDKLVVAFGSENANGILSITYGGVAMNQALYSDGAREIAIFYLDNPVANGDLFIDPIGGSVNGMGGTLFALSGTALGFGASNSTAGTSTSLAVDAGSFVVAVAARNGTTLPAASSPLTGAFSGGSGSSTSGTGYQLISTSGGITPAFTNTPEWVGAVEFEAIPEPSAACLGLCGLLLLMRRRR